MELEEEKFKLSEEEKKFLLSIAERFKGVDIFPELNAAAREFLRKVDFDFSKLT